MENEPRIDRAQSQRHILLGILRYMVAHPKAKDTISGIEKWWLSQSVNPEGSRNLQTNLDWLVAKGWLNSRYSRESGTIYSLNQDRLPEIQEFLARND